MSTNHVTWRHRTWMVIENELTKKIVAHSKLGLRRRLHSYTLGLRLRWSRISFDSSSFLDHELIRWSDIVCEQIPLNTMSKKSMVNVFIESQKNGRFWSSTIYVILFKLKLISIIDNRNGNELEIYLTRVLTHWLWTVRLTIQRKKIVKRRHLPSISWPFSEINRIQD